MQKKLVIVIFLRKKTQIFLLFYGQRSVTAVWATPSPWSIYFKNEIVSNCEGGLGRKHVTGVGNHARGKSLYMLLKYRKNASISSPLSFPRNEIKYPQNMRKT